MSIRDILLSLSPKEKATLDYAREYGLSQFIRYGENRFIGINAERISFLQIEETAGQWSIGTIKMKGVVAK